jgi:GAF domain
VRSDEIHSDSRMRAALGAAVTEGDSSLASADRLCRACVELLDVDGAAFSVVRDGASAGTFGSSGALSRRLDEFQFTLGEGPCLDAARQGQPVLVADLTRSGEDRWPAFAQAMVETGVRAVFALPVTVAGSRVGALDLFRHAAGPLGDKNLAGGLLAARLAVLPLMDLITGGTDWAAAAEGRAGPPELASLARVEVYQATGMIMAGLDVGPDEALVRLRAFAFARRLTASEVAWKIVEGDLRLDADSSWYAPGGPSGPSS